MLNVLGLEYTEDQPLVLDDYLTALVPPEHAPLAPDGREQVRSSLPFLV